jgi:hypothetical protein
MNRIVEKIHKRGAPMAKIGHWKDGKRDREWLFWDNKELLRQIGPVK